MDDRENHPHLLDALNAIPCAALVYNDWLACGFALHESGYDLEDWQRWSATDPKRYNAKTCERMWADFGRKEGERVKSGTITRMAERYGWTQPTDGGPQQMFGWDDVGYAVNMPEYVQKPAQQAAQVSPMDKYGLCKWESLPTPYELAPLPDDLKPAEMFTAQLDAMFQAGERVNVVLEHEIVEGEHEGMGGEAHSVEDLHANAQNALDRSNKELGAYICVNPVNGSRKNENVTARRNVLVECDKLPDKDKQLELIRSLGLPCRCIVYSGNKSIHAVVAIDAKDEAEYRERARALYDYCKANGLPVDEACKNPSRLMRLAGARRDEYMQMQRLIATNHKGPKTWDEFVNKVQRLHAEQQQPNGPVELNLADFINEPDKPKDWVIVGVVARGEVEDMHALSGSGKTTCLYSCGIAGATGGEWLGYRIKQTNVVLVDPEMTIDAIKRRMKTVCRAMGVTQEQIGRRLTVLSGRLAPITIESLKKCLEEQRAAGHACGLLLIDSISVLLASDTNANENDNAYINRVFFDIKQIAASMHCAVVVTHHPPKNAGSAYQSSGTLARGAEAFRAAPDVVASLIPLFVPDGSGAQELMKTYAKEVFDEATNKRITIFPKAVRLKYEKNRDGYPLEDVNLIFDYPLHKVDHTGELALCKTSLGEQRAPHEAGGETTKEKNKQKRDEADQAFVCIIQDLESKGEKPDEDAAMPLFNEWRRDHGMKEVSSDTAKRYAKDGRLPSVAWDTKEKCFRVREDGGNEADAQERTDGQG